VTTGVALWCWPNPTYYLARTPYNYYAKKIIKQPAVQRVKEAVAEIKRVQRFTPRSPISIHWTTPGC
jgi:hypothetical protein